MVPVVAALPEARPGDLPLVGEDVLQGLGEGLEDLFLPHGAFHHQVKPRAAAHGGEVNDPREVVPQIPCEEVCKAPVGRASRLGWASLRSYFSTTPPARAFLPARRT